MGILRSLLLAILCLLALSAPLAAKKKRFAPVARPRTYKDAKPLPQSVRKPKHFSIPKSRESVKNPNAPEYRPVKPAKKDKPAKNADPAD